MYLFQTPDLAHVDGVFGVPGPQHFDEIITFHQPGPDATAGAGDLVLFDVDHKLLDDAGLAEDRLDVDHGHLQIDLRPQVVDHFVDDVELFDGDSLFGVFHDFSRRHRNVEGVDDAVEGLGVFDVLIKAKDLLLFPKLAPTNYL